MMISPQNYEAELENKTYPELIRERNELMELIRKFEQDELAGDRSDPSWHVCPMPDVQYQMLSKGKLTAEEEEGAGARGARACAPSESRRSVKGIVRGTYGFLVPDMDDHEDYDAANITEDDRILAKAMLQMLEDEELQRHYSEAAKERALTYTPDRYRQALTDTLTDILENRVL